MLGAGKNKPSGAQLSLCMRSPGPIPKRALSTEPGAGTEHCRVCPQTKRRTPSFSCGADKTRVEWHNRSQWTAEAPYMSGTQCFQSYGNPSLSDWNGRLRSTLEPTCQCQSSVEGRQVLDSLLQQSHPMLAPSQSAVLVKCVCVCRFLGNTAWWSLLWLKSLSSDHPLYPSLAPPVLKGVTTHVPSSPNLSPVSPKLNRCPCICATAVMVLVGGMASSMGVIKPEDTPLEQGGGLEGTLAEVTVQMAGSGEAWICLSVLPHIHASSLVTHLQSEV